MGRGAGDARRRGCVPAAARADPGPRRPALPARAVRGRPPRARVRGRGARRVARARGDRRRRWPRRSATRSQSCSSGSRRPRRTPTRAGTSLARCRGTSARSARSAATTPAPPCSCTTRRSSSGATCSTGSSARPRLSIEMARLRVEVRLQLAEVEASRARIVEAGYEERRRLERDLHDGAQQRLVSLGVQLRRLQLRSAPRRRVALARARSGVGRGRSDDRRPPPDRGGRSAGAARRRPGGRAARPRAFRAGPGRGRGATGARGGERRGSRVLRRLRGAHECRQARLAVEGRGAGLPGERDAARERVRRRRRRGGRPPRLRPRGTPGPRRRARRHVRAP